MASSRVSRERIHFGRMGRVDGTVGRRGILRCYYAEHLRIAFGLELGHRMA